jgi:hypothetical protein
MLNLAQLLGYLILTFFLLSMTNGLKRYIRIKPIMVIARYHRIFGVLATLTAFVHMAANLANGNLNPLGALSLLALIMTGAFGYLFSKNPTKKQLYTAHRVAGFAAFLFITIHIIGNII